MHTILIIKNGPRVASLLTPFGVSIGLQALPLSYFPWLVGILFSYCVLTQLVKNWYIRKFSGWL
jgi:Mg2+-importing ATPase